MICYAKYLKYIITLMIEKIRRSRSESLQNNKKTTTFIGTLSKSRSRSLFIHLRTLYTELHFLSGAICASAV